MKSIQTLKSVVLLIAALQLQSVIAEDWPQWRGPARNGIASGNGSINEDSKFEILWKRPLGIGGYSSVIVSNGFAYTTFSDGKNDYTICLSAVTGQEIWRFRMDETFPVSS